MKGQRTNPKYRISVKTIPHPEPDRALDVLAKFFLPIVLEEHRKSTERG